MGRLERGRCLVSLGFDWGSRGGWWVGLSGVGLVQWKDS